MPELPEVEVWRRLIHDWVRTDPIEEVAFPDSSLLPDSPREEAKNLLVGRPPDGLRRIGKLLLWHRSDQPSLGIHLRMTGGFSRTKNGSSPPRFTRATWRLQSGVGIHFTDSRRLGQFHWGPREHVEREMGVHRLGPDALDDLPEVSVLQNRIGNRKQLKPALMDQGVLAGIGNIAATEICHRARLSPWSRPALLTSSQWGSLHTQIRHHLRESISRDEGREITYVNAGGSNPFSIYAREGEPCPHCAQPVVRAKQAGRSTFFCSQCQPTE